MWKKRRKAIFEVFGKSASDSGKGLRPAQFNPAPKEDRRAGKSKSGLMGLLAITGGRAKTSFSSSPVWRATIPGTLFLGSSC